MQRSKIKLIEFLTFLITILLLSQVSLSYALSREKPNHCPTAGAIMAAGVQNVQIASNSSWYAFHYSQYDTNYVGWRLTVRGDEKVYDFMAAQRAADKALPTLQLVREEELMDNFYCYYQGEQSSATAKCDTETCYKPW